MAHPSRTATFRKMPIYSLCGDGCMMALEDCRQPTMIDTTGAIRTSYEAYLKLHNSCDHPHPACIATTMT
jgi:hypothetical protein